MDFNQACTELNINEDRGEFHAFLQGALKCWRGQLPQLSRDDWSLWLETFYKCQQDGDAADLAATQQAALGRPF